MQMKVFRKLKIDPGPAICYSGFRQGQNPGGIYPAYEEVKEDLLLLHKHWKYLRLFDCDQHAETVLEVISRKNLISN
jgi:hypothetical protein